MRTCPAVDVVEGLAEVVGDGMDPWWRWYSEEPGPRRAFALFVGQYAYERQGRARSYPHAANFAIEGCRALEAAEIWQTFQDELHGAKSNPRLNPLNHSATNCNCARCIFTNSDGGLADVVEVMRSDLVNGDVLRAFDRADSVRGIGPKIASFSSETLPSGSGLSRLSIVNCYSQLMSGCGGMWHSSMVEP